jgi:hypothetical protein
MRKLIILTVFTAFIISSLKAQRNDTIPNCYCDCIDTNEILGDKILFFDSFEKTVLKTNLTTLQYLNEEGYRTYFDNLYTKAYIHQQLILDNGEYVRYRSSPLCSLLQKHLRIRLDIEQQKQFYQQFSDSLKLNSEIQNLRYRIWVLPSFIKPKLLEIYINPDNLNEKKAITYTFENFIIYWKKAFDNKISEKKMLDVDSEKWNFFSKITPTYRLEKLPQQKNELGFRYTSKDGYFLIIEIYENGELLHLLEYSNPFREGSESHNASFREFYKLLNNTFDWQPFDRE